MAIALFQPHHSFGLLSNISGNINYLDEQTLIYPSGNQLIRFNLDLKLQSFIPGSDKTSGMSAITLSPNRRYVAFAERSENPIIMIYDLLHDQSKKRKTLNVPDIQANEFISLAFSPDSKFLVAQGGDPDWTLVLWAWEKSKIVATVKTSSQANQAVHQVSFNPQDNTQVCVIGDHIFKLFRYIDGNFKHFGFQRMEPQNLLSHAWISDERVVVGNDCGKLLLIENGEVKAEFAITPPNESAKPTATRMQDDFQIDIDVVPDDDDDVTVSEATPILAVVAFSKGFACSAENGAVHLFEKTGEKEKYLKTKVVKIPTDLHSSDINLHGNKTIIVSLVVSPSEEVLVAASNRSQLYQHSLLPADSSKDEVYFSPLTHSYHSDCITGLDVCIRKPLVATCSIDHSVRIWNFETNSLDIYKIFQEEAYSISLHPSGLFIVVGFSDKLRLMNILIDDIRVFKEIPIRGCRECAFTNGGHLFAAVHGSIIQLYSSSTFENIANLKGHNGKIRSIAWSADDNKLVSCGMDGAVYEWCTADSKRLNEVVLKSCAYFCVAVSPSGKYSYAVGSDKSVKEITESQIVHAVDAGGATLTQVAMSRNGKMIFCGTSTGTLRAFKYPFTSTGEWNEQQAHAMQITKMQITYDDQFLITASEDACLIIWKIFDKDGRGLKLDKDFEYAEEILITKTDLEEKNMVMSELRTRVEELKMENEYQLRLKDMNYNEKIKELTEKFIQEMEGLNIKNQSLKIEKEKEAAKHEDQLADREETHSKLIQNMETKNNQKLIEEYQKFHNLQAKYEKMQESYHNQLVDADASKEQALQELTEFYETKLLEKCSQLDQIQDESRLQHRESEEMKKQMEEDADREILEIKTKYERKLREEIDTNLRLKGETGIMRKKFNSLNKEIERKNVEIRHTSQEKLKLEGIIRCLEQEIIHLKKEIQERDETIQDKEKRIYDLKKKNQELEKFKFVLDYKIKELKKQIEPRENDIKVMREQILEMEGELERFHKQNNTLQLGVNEQKQKLRATEKELRRAEGATREVEAMNRRIKTEIYNCVSFIQEPKKLKDSIKSIFHTYITADLVKERGLDADIHMEYMRQREHLERSVASLRNKLMKDTEIHRTDNVRIMQENVTLIKEINDLRRALKSTRSYISDLETSLGMANLKKSFAVEKQSSAPGTKADAAPVMRQSGVVETTRIIEMQRNEIRKLRNQVMDLDDKLARRPQTTNKLPPMVAATQ